MNGFSSKPIFYFLKFFPQKPCFFSDIYSPDRVFGNRTRADQLIEEVLNYINEIARLTVRQTITIREAEDFLSPNVFPQLADASGEKRNENSPVFFSEVERKVADFPEALSPL